MENKSLLELMRPLVYEYNCTLVKLEIEILKSMRQKIVVYNKATDQTIYFSSYEEAAKHLDVKASKLQRIANTGEVINYIYTIKTK